MLDKFNIHIIEDALESSRDLAYSSVQNPTEGHNAYDNQGHT
jgi:dihydroxyacetone kinase-like predicted kinase